MVEVGCAGLLGGECLGAEVDEGKGRANSELEEEKASTPTPYFHCYGL
jgi:hypothetical protein